MDPRLSTPNGSSRWSRPVWANGSTQGDGDGSTSVSVSALESAALPPPAIADRRRSSTVDHLDPVLLARGELGEESCRWRSLKPNNCECSSDYGARASSQ